MLEIIKETGQFGFAGTVAFIMIFLMWKITIFGLNAFKEVVQDNRIQLDNLHKQHSKERIECYEKQERQINKFDDTINKALDKIK